MFMLFENGKLVERLLLDRFLNHLCMMYKERKHEKESSLIT